MTERNDFKMTTLLQEESKDSKIEQEESKSIRKNKAGFKMLKRSLDVVTSLLVLPFVGIFVLIFGIMIKLEDGGPIFYSQRRVGQGLKEFNIFKMRSMKDNAEQFSGSVWAEKNDPRITKVGKVIRKYRIDELPQFLNVIKGDMSIIGPRPERLDLTLKFNEQIPGFLDRLQVKPGITGLAQVNGGYDINPSEKLLLDRKYIENFGIKQDFNIVFKTIKVVLTGEGSR